MSSERDTEVDRRINLTLMANRARPLVSWTDARGPQRLQLDRTALIGASEHAQVSIRSDRLVSRVHAELTVREDGVWVRDLGSRNGTQLEALVVQHARVPEAGGTVVVGATEIVLSMGPTRAQVPLWPTEQLHDLLGRSESSRELFMRVSEVARSEAPVLIHGETGTGKELVAHALHASSSRHDKPFIVVDCGALAESLLESELFGHAKGAFTGAHSARVGAFEAAEGGTVFLDEVGELPLSVQPKLLRVLESRTVKRLGENDPFSVNFRVIAATHRDLEQMVADGTFREDLYFRLAVLPLTVPALRERRDDVELLVRHFAAGRAAFTPDELKRLSSHPWPGNVRELRSFVERAVALGFSTAWAMLTGQTTAPRAAQGVPGQLPPVNVEVPFKELREKWTDYLERQYLVALIAKHGRQSPTALAEAAGLDRSYLHRLLKKHLL
jgi:transcriptional regulator with GAF, ATPase, and Fis domain